MKKRVLLALTLLLALVLAVGCGAKEEAPPAAVDDLTPVLESISANVQFATAGSMLRAAQQACALMDWCCRTDMDEAAIRGALEAFLASRNLEDRQLFTEQLDSVLSMADYLRNEDGVGLLDDIGGAEGTLWPWEDAPTEKLAALRDAAQLS